MSMPLKEWLIKKLSQKLNTPEKLIDLVISDQFTSAFRATSTHNSIELSGFGKFVFNIKKAHAQMAKYDSQMNVFSGLLSRAITPQEIAVANLKISIVQKNIDHLKTKLHEPKTDIRGVEESSAP